MKKAKRCYWCGKPASSKDHVPPKGLFLENKRENLKTVPACEKHNEEHTKLEEAMRARLIMMSDSKIALEAYGEATERSLNDEKSMGLAHRLFSGMDSKTLAVGLGPTLKLPPEDYSLYFEKIARGVYYLVNKTCFDGDCFVAFRQSFLAHKGFAEIFHRLEPHFANPELAKPGKVSHTDIFQYKYISYITPLLFAVEMLFYESVQVIAILSGPGVFGGGAVST
ncbi:MAG: hypothetical protein ABSE62_14595 [Chthoniobacteraceae bacterium]